MNRRAYGFPERKPNRKKAFFSWGRCPQTPGIYRFPAGMLVFLGRLAPPRWRALPHSGRWIGAQVASLRCPILRPGEVSINRAGGRKMTQLEKLLPKVPPVR